MIFIVGGLVYYILTPSESESKTKSVKKKAQSKPSPKLERKEGDDSPDMDYIPAHVKNIHSMKKRK